MSGQAVEMLRKLLDESERERAAMKRSLEGVLGSQRLAEAVCRVDDEAGVAEALASAVSDVLDGAATTVWLGDGNRPLRQVRSADMVDLALRRFSEMEDEGILRWTLEGRKPVATPLDGADEGRGWILVPLLVGERPIGIAGAIPFLPLDRIAAHQMEMLRLVGIQGAIAFDNIQHIEDARKNGGELRSLYGIAEALGRSLDAATVFREIASRIGERWSTCCVAMGLVDGRSFADRDGTEVAAPFLRDAGADRIRLYDREISHAAELGALGAAMAFQVPLLGPEGRVGTLLVGHAEPGFGRARDVVEWFETVGRLLSASLENVRLYEESVVSNRKLSELQNRLVQAGRLAGIGQLAGGIAHEINNPLQVILGRVQILQMRCQGDEKVATDLKRLESETMRIAQIVRGMQEFARQEPGDSPMGPVMLSVVVEAVLELVDFRLRRHKVEVVREGFEQSLCVEGNPDELKHLVLGLCLNSIQAMPSGGRLTIGILRRGSEAVVEVADTGTGIAPEDMDRIFDPFFSRKPGAMGMGLAMGYSIAQRHGGSIHAVPGLEQGAALRVVLPAIS